MSDFFQSGLPVVEASAPGRMDVMGGISDYSGSLLLQMPIRQTTQVRVQQRDDGSVHIRSIESKRKTLFFSISIDQLRGKDYYQVSELLRNLQGGDWASYVIGCILVFHQEKNIPLCGMNISIESTVPVGKGVSSSAALEVALSCALVKLFDIDIGSEELPLLAQKAENLVVGAPCGLMDQLSSYLGHKNKLLPLICQPHQVLPAISIPSGVFFYAIDSGIRHAVSGASYSDVRAAAFMGYTMIARKKGVSAEALINARDSGQWTNLPYGGFLANISVSKFDQEYASWLPEEITGQQFLDEYGVSIDTVTKILPDKSYRILACAQHPVRENFRIHSFMNMLAALPKQRNKTDSLVLMGEMMYQSHAGYSAVGLGNIHTDEIVERVRTAGAEASVFGARITGGGSGGTVCIMGYGNEGKKTVEQIFIDYRQHHQIKSFLFKGSSEGARFLNK